MLLIYVNVSFDATLLSRVSYLARFRGPEHGAGVLLWVELGGMRMER